MQRIIVNRVQRGYQCARECQYLFPVASELAVMNGDIVSNPSAATCIANALDVIDRFEGTPAEEPTRQIDYKELMALPPERFGVPETFSCGTRYGITIRATPAFYQRLKRFTDDLARIDFTGVKVVYTNFAIRAALRAAIAIYKGFCPIV